MSDVFRISRRQAFSLIGLTAGLGLAAPMVLTASNAEAQIQPPQTQGQSPGQERRDDRQEGRQQRRDDRQEERQQRQDERRN